MKKTAKYLVYMLTVVLIASVIGVAFAWYSSNTTVTATSSATAARAENVDISFVFTDDDDSDNKIYLSTAQLIIDYYNRNIYSGEEGWSAALGGMVGCETQEKDGKVYLKDPNVRADQINELNEYMGTRDHAFTLYYYIEITNNGSATSFGLNLNSVKIYKNGLTLRDTNGDEVENANVEYPVIIGEDENAQPAGNGTIAKVTIGSTGTVCYFDVTQTTVYSALDDDGHLSEEMTGASYNVSGCKLTVGGKDYVLSGHESDKSIKDARYFKSDAEEGTADGSTVDNFVFNFYDISDKDFYDKENGTHQSKIFNKAHEGNYNLYTGADELFAEAGESIEVADGETAKIIIAITHFQKIEVDETGNILTVIDSIFPYSAKEYMKAHFKFNIRAELSK